MNSALMNWFNSYCFHVMSRIMAAAVGGYLFTTMLSIFLSRILPMSPADALMTAMLLSFCVYAVVIMWVFAAGSTLRAWLGVSVPTTLCSVLVWMMGSAGSV